MFCPHCGKEIKKNKFCQYCGGKITKQYFGKWIMVGVIGIAIVIFIMASAIISHITMISDEQFQKLMQNVTTTKIRDVESYFYVDEITILSKKKDKESKQIIVTCDVTMTDNAVAADVKYIVFCNKLDGTWRITRTTIDMVYDIKPLQGTVAPTDIVEDSIQGLYPQINWGYTDYNIFGNNIDYNFPISWSLKEKNTDLENKKEQFVYEYYFMTYTARVTGVLEFNYKFSYSGVWKLESVEHKGSNIEWNLEEVWSFNIYTYYSDVFITNINWETQQAEIWCRGAVVQGAGKFQKTILGFTVEDDTITFTPLKISKKNGDSELIFTVRLEDMCINETAIGGKSQYLTVEDVQSLIGQNQESQNGDNVSLVNPGYKNNIALLMVDSNEENSGSLYKGSQIRECTILSVDENTNVVRGVNVYPNALFYTETDENNQNRYAKFQLAYADGAEQTIKSLNMMLDLDIADFIVIGRKELAEIVDIVGGISYEINDFELERMNTSAETQIQTTGNVILNGEQVVALFFPMMSSHYCADDNEEMNLKNNIMKAISYKISNLDVAEYNNLKEHIGEYMYTSIGEEQVMKLLTDFSQIEEYMDFPCYETSKKEALGMYGSCIYSENMSEDVSKLHLFLYGQKDYAPSDAVTAFSAEMQELVNEYIRQ